MKESSFYQMILDEGRADGMVEGFAQNFARGYAQGFAEGLVKGATREARRILLRQGERLYGSPDPETVAAIERIAEVERLEDLIDRVTEVASWAELLATPPDTE